MSLEFSHGKNKTKNHLTPSDILRVLCEAYLQKVVYENSPSDHETRSILTLCSKPCRLSIHVAFTYSVSPSKRSVKQTWTGSAFSTNESA